MVFDPIHLAELETRINYQFCTPTLLHEALTHRSFVRGKYRYLRHNERLEFLGDSILKLIVTEYLFDLYPKHDEGQLSKLRSQLISDQFLMYMASSIQLGSYLKLAYGEDKSGGAYRLSNLSNAMEAVLGACFLDGGLGAAKQVFFSIFKEVEGQLPSLLVIDYKSKLQEFCQKSGLSLPIYNLTASTGPEHDRLFLVSVSLHYQKELRQATGEAKTKKQAEQLAAKQLMVELHISVT